MSNHSPVGSEHHITPVSTYLKVYAALLVLMAATIIASYLPLGAFGNNFVAMGIAITKAGLVIAIFMGVKYATNLTKIWAMLGFFWVILVFGILIDYSSRVPIAGFMKDNQGTTIPRGPQMVKD